MKIMFYCFSGTGNTRRVCEKLAQELENRGHEAEIYLVTRRSAPPAPCGYDRVIAAYPVHAFNAPAAMLKFLKKLPRIRGGKSEVPVYLLRTSGEPLRLNDASGISPRRILRRRGYAVKGEIHFVMPYNIIFRHSEGMAARMDRTVDLGLSSAADAVISGGGQICRVGPVRRLVSFVLRIEHPAMPLIGRTFHVSSACMGCGLCERRCPQGNIRIVNGKPKFGGSCVGCMGCAFRCPADAIRTSLLNGWRVNGEYDFSAPPASDNEVCRYCHKSYVRYFHAKEEPENAGAQTAEER